MQKILMPLRDPARLTLILGGTIALLMVFAVSLWAKFGSTVFFEVIRNGLSACMG